MSGFIYAIRSGDFVKIGYAADPWKRRSSIRLANPHPCEMLGFSPGSRADEKALHSKFSAYHHRGEWFRNEGPVAEFAMGLDHRDSDHDRRRGPRSPEKIANMTAALRAAWARRDEAYRIACERYSQSRPAA